MTRRDSVIALLRGRLTVAQVAHTHGVSESEVHEWRELFLSGLVVRRRVSRLAWVVLTTVVVVVVGVVSTRAWAGTCPSTLRSPLFTMCANEPARAEEVNANFAQLLTWLEAKIGNVATSGVSAASVTTTGAVMAGSVTAGTLTTTGNVRVGGSLSVSGTSFGAYSDQLSNTDHTAATDGFVTVSIVGTNDGARCYVHGLVDGTIRTRGSVHFYTGSDTRVNDDGITFPVGKGSIWRVSHANTAGTCTVLVSWIPLNP